MIQKSFIDLDGAPHPSWNQKFKFKFTQPLLTSCQVVSSEVIKIKVELLQKYVLLLLRESKRSVGDGGPNKFRFCTIYDPRSATEYQCGIKEGCQLYNALYYGTVTEVEVKKRSEDKAKRGSYDNCSFSDSDYMTYIVEASEQHKIVLGPAITPRLEVHVYNDNGRSQELLGSSQISISSVLSGTGIVEKRWYCLHYKVDNTDDASKSIDVVAGEIELEMKFVSSGVLEAEKKSDDNVEKRKSKLKSSKTSFESTRAPTAGDQELNADLDGKESSKEGKGSDSKVKLKDVQKELEALKMDKTSLTLECEKLKEKISSSNRSGGEKTNADDKIVGELQVTKEQKDKLVKDIKIISDEKQLLLANTTKLEADNRKLLEENKRLKDAEAIAQKQLEKLNLKGEAEKNVTPVLFSSSSTTATSTSVQGIVKVLMERDEKKRRMGTIVVDDSDSPLDSLQRLLLSYEKQNGSIEPKYIQSSLSDLLIDLHMDHVKKICEEIGYDPSTGAVTTSKVIDHFKRELDSLTGGSNKDSKKVLLDPPAVIVALPKPTVSDKEVRSSKDETKDRNRPKSAIEVHSPSPGSTLNNTLGSTSNSNSSIGLGGQQRMSMDWSNKPVSHPWERFVDTKTNRV